MKYGIFTVYSSHGEITVELNTGMVLKVEAYDPLANDSINYITSFDVAEFEQHYSRKIEPDEDIDILSIAYHMEDGSYVPAEADWRKEMKLNQEK